MMTMENIQVRLSRDDRMSASFTAPDGIYHIWFDPSTMKLLHNSILFKNPPKGRVARTKRLDGTNRTNAPIVEALLKTIIDRKLIEAARAAIKTNQSHDVRAFVREYWENVMRIDSCRAPLPADISDDEFRAVSKNLADELFL